MKEEKFLDNMLWWNTILVQDRFWQFLPNDWYKMQNGLEIMKL